MSIIIPFNEFANFCFCKEDDKKYKIVKEFKYKNEKEFIPYYGVLKNTLIRFHKENKSKDFLIDFISNYTNKDKKIFFNNLIINYIDWLESNSGIKFINQPINNKIDLEYVTITLGFDIELQINNKPHIIKYYFNKDQQPEQKTLLCLNLLNKLNDKTDNEVCIFDINRKRFSLFSSPNSALDLFIYDKAASFSAIFQRL